MEIESVSPANNATGLPLQTVVSVTFDEEVDLDSIVNGAFVVTSSAKQLVVEGPGSEDFRFPVEKDLLASNTYTGFVDGTITTDDNLTFLFTPSKDLLPNTTLKVYIGTKTVTKTVGPINSSSAEGTGSIELLGPYTGDDDSFELEITTPGVLGTARFTYRRASSGITSSPLTTDRLVELEDGLFVIFKAGEYLEGDIFSFDVFEGTPLSDIYTWTFSTGAASYVEVSDQIPSVHIERREVQGIVRIDSSSASDVGQLSLLSVTPADEASNVPLGFNSIILTFNKDLDPDSLSDALIEVLMESLPLDETITASNKLRVIPIVSGNKLTLRFQG